MNNDILILLKDAKKEGVNISFSDGKLAYSLDKNIKAPNELINSLKANKEAIIEFLEDDNQLDFREVLPPINKRPVELKHIPLSFSQERLWFTHQLQGSTNYHIPTVLRLKGKLDVSALNNAFSDIIQRHEVLRTVFSEEDGKVYQKTLRQKKQTFFDDIIVLEDEKKLGDYINDTIYQPFDLSLDLMLRARLIKTRETEHVLIIVIHHIAFDGGSQALFINEMTELYRSHLEQRKNSLQELKLQYADYAVWQRRYIDGPILKSMLAYWETKLKDVSPLKLPTDFVRPAVQSVKGKSLSFQFTKQMSYEMHTFSNDEGVTLYMTLLAAFKVLLYRYSGQNDICVGCSIAGRRHKDIEPLIGFFLNALTLRTKFENSPNGKSPTFLQVLQSVKETTLGAYMNQDVPFAKVVERVQTTRDTSRTPLFQVMFDMQDNMSDVDGDLTDLNLSHVGFDHNTSKFDLSFNVTDDAIDGISVRVEYCSDLFSESTIQRMAGHYQTLLQAILVDPTCEVTALNMLSEAERHQLSSQFNRSELKSPSTTLINLFEQQVAKSPENLAVIFGDTQLTFTELNKKANKLANSLREDYKVKNDTIVGVMLERSDDLIISILAILKAGGAFLPLDKSYPANRLAYMLKDSATSTLITDSSTMFEVSDFYQGGILAIDIQGETLDYPEEDLRVSINADDIAYVIYTSGSSGRPKGVKITHANIVNYLIWANTYYFNDQQGFIFGLFTSLSFDLTITSLLSGLLRGDAVYVYPEDEISNILTHVFRKDTPVNTVKFTPSHASILQYLNINETNIKRIILGGEPVQQDQIQYLKSLNDNLEIFNEYGPTEATVGCIAVNVKEVDNLRVIGKAISNTAISIVNQSMEYQPVGVYGQIVVRGSSVSPGYLNQPELTAEKFICDTPGTHKDRGYLTGDKARWLPDGSIEYAGRFDDQVKFKGFRIEPGEVEAVLQQSELIQQCAVLLLDDESNDSRLMAYVIPKENYDHAHLLSFLSSQLPSYMIPSEIIESTHFPLTANGKLDRKKLISDFNVDTKQGELILPTSELEQQLYVIWQEILGKKNLSVSDDFFSLGGDSITAIRLISSINNAMNLTLEVKDLFACPSVQKLAEDIENNHETHGINVLHESIRNGKDLIEKLEQSILNNPRLKGKLPSSYEAIFPMTAIERGLIYSSIIRREEPIYYDQFAYNFDVEDIQKLDETLQIVFNANQCFSARYYVSTFEEAVKIISKAAILPYTVEDISNIEVEKQRSIIAAYRDSDLKRRLDFEGDLLWKVHVFVLSDTNVEVVFSFHHALFDGWSVRLIKFQLMELLSGEYPDLPAIEQTYKDYHALILGRSINEETHQYWAEMLEGYSRNKLPFNHSKKNMEYDKQPQVIIGKYFETELLEDIRKIARENQVSLKSILLSAHVYVMGIVSAENDVVTGVVTHDRPALLNADKILGCFLNTTPIRVNIEEHKNYHDLVGRVNQFLIDVQPHEIHLTEIAEIIEEKATLENPIFDCIFNFTDFHHVQHANVESIAVTNDQMPHEDNLLSDAEMTNTLLDLEVDVSSGFLSVRIKFLPAYFTRDEMQYTLDLYVRILRDMIQTLNNPMDPSKLLLDGERHFLFKQFNDTIRPYSHNKTIHSLFEEQCKKTPHNVALIQDDQHLTYNELDKRASNLASYLVANGVDSRENIGILCNRGFEMIIGMYAILKAGAAYVPIDPEYPLERQQYIISNSEIKRVLIDINHPITDNSPELEFVHITSKFTKQHGQNLLPKEKSSSDLAYIIYTSGSTGKPKGVMIAHNSAVNLIEWVNKRFEIGEQDKMLFITSVCFDLSVYDIFGMLASGGSIVIAHHNQVQDISKSIRLLKNEKITFWDSVPTTMNHLIGELEYSEEHYRQFQLRLVFLSGDWIPTGLPDRIKSYFPNADVISLGGATEGTVWSNYFPINKVEKHWESIPYGEPISNNFFYVLDEKLKPVLPGTVGELFIGGIGVALGYANDESKTNYSYMADPFNNELGGRMYRTGDLGRILPDGNMQFVGRKDHQVKIRGFRVELGEIESTLAKMDDIHEVVVNSFTDQSGHKQLCAYIVAENEISQPVLREYVLKKLPSYMIPAYFVTLPELPINSNGKVDRNRLPKPDENPLVKSTYIQPVTVLEQKLAEIWEGILGIDKVGVYDNLLELGAHSLNLGTFVNRVHRQFNVQLPLATIFQSPDIKSIAANIRQSSNNTFQTIPQIDEQQYYEVSHAQRRLWIAAQSEQGNAAYKQSAVFQLKEVNPVLFRKALGVLIQRHESLRTSIVNINGIPKQQIHQFSTELIPFEQIEIHDNNLNIDDIIEQEYSRPMPLDSWSLIRLLLIENNKNDYYLIFSIHHIVSDGWSMEVLTHEFTSVYHALINNHSYYLEPLRIQYKDYAAWHNNLLSGESLEAHKKFWQKKMSGDLSPLDFPVDFERPKVHTFNGARKHFTLDPDDYTALKAATKKSEVTLFITLMTCVTVLMHHYTEKEDIILGSPLSGREHVDLEDQIGFYVNTLPFRIVFSQDDKIESLLQHVKRAAVEVYEHQVYPFDLLVEQLGVKRDVSRALLFDVVVALQNARYNLTLGEETKGEIAAENYDAGHAVSTHDLMFQFSESTEDLTLTIIYSTDLFKEETISLLFEKFVLLTSLLEESTASVGQLELLTSTELELASRTDEIRFDDSLF